MLRVAGPNKSRHITHARHTRSRQDDVRAAKHIKLSPFSTSLEPSFSDTRGSLNFLIVHSCSQNPPLISCISAYKFQRRITLLGLISITGVKQLRALLAKKCQRRPQLFCTFSVQPLVIYNCALYNWKLLHHLRDIRLLNIPWPWNSG